MDTNLELNCQHTTYDLTQTPLYRLSLELKYHLIQTPEKAKLVSDEDLTTSEWTQVDMYLRLAHF